MFSKTDVDQIVTIAKSAGEKLKQWSSEGFHVNSKNTRTDLVTDVDYMIQEYLIKEISQSFKNSAFLAEESGYEHIPKEQSYWVIDPIDGTVNFSRGIPENCISIAYVENREPVLGIIYAPFMNLFYFAQKGKGTFLNDEKVNPHWCNNFEDAMLSLGNKRGKTHLYFQALEEKVMRIRLFGTAALQIAYVSSGFLDAFISVGSHPWDIAAAYLLVKEAGGKVVKLNGKDADIFYSNAIYCNPYIADELVNIVSKVDK